MMRATPSAFRHRGVGLPLPLPLLLLLLALTLSYTATAQGVGPAIATNFADPCLALGPDNTTWYAFSTQTDQINIQVASSPDFSTWTLHRGFDALPTLPSWAVAPPHAHVWAPDVNPRPDGSYVMYFAAVGANHPGKHCIGAAVSPNITGPYTPLETTIVCDLPQGGNIDPNLFQDPVSGNNYLIYKVDGNAVGNGGQCGNTVAPIAPTPLYLLQLDNTDLVTPVGTPLYLFSNIGSFEYDGANVERPCLIFRDDTYYVVYNSKCYASLRYRINYVSCVVGVDTFTGIAGCNWPLLKDIQESWGNHTLLKTGDVVSNTTMNAPGSMDVSPDNRKVVYHADVNLAWFAPHNDSVHRDRAMFAAAVDFVHSNLRITELY